VSWLPFQYRDFYDIPRAFVLSFHGETYFFDCPFDDEIDSYSPVYTVYRLPDLCDHEADEGSWVKLSQQGMRCGSVATASAVFDPTRRRLINSEIFEEL
jgi:hypothetical protein